MYYITTKKASGVISGVQTTENGPIQWSRDLPNSCLLSQGLKKHLTPILAGLLEVNPQKMWTFEKFFNEVTSLLSKKKLFLYFINKLTAHRVYLDKSQHLEDFQLLLTEQTDVEPGSQILMLEDNLLTKLVDVGVPGTSFPDTTATNPIILFAKNNNSVKFTDDRELSTFPSLPNLVSVEQDATLAKSATAIGYAHKRRIEQCTNCDKIIGIAVKQFVSVIINQLEKLQDIADKCKTLTKATESQISFFNQTHEASRALMESLLSPEGDNSNYMSDIWKQIESIQMEETDSFGRLQNLLTDLAPAVHQLHKRYFLTY